MALCNVYYKFKSEKSHNAIRVLDHFISCASLKERIFESRYVNSSGTDRDLQITNLQTNQVYDETMLIPKDTSVLVCRIPRHPRIRYVSDQNNSEIECLQEKTAVTLEDVPSDKDVEPSTKLDDEFGPEIYAPFPEPTPVKASNAAQCAPTLTKDDEDRRLKAVIETPALDWQSEANRGIGRYSGFGRMMAGRGFGRAGFQREKPPQGYVCHRCNEPGHLIQHCPTNGDPEYDLKRVKPPTGIPKTMIMATPDGSHTSFNERSTRESKIGRFPTTCSQGDLPPELFCLLCKEVMKDAVLTTKCCFKSYCDKCIRDYLIAKSICVCGAKDILADDLVPNKTLRDTINRILESSTSGSSCITEDKERSSAVPPTQQNSDKRKYEHNKRKYEHNHSHSMERSASRIRVE